MNAVCPVFFKLIAMMEQYHPRVALYWELTRYLDFYTSLNFLKPHIPFKLVKVMVTIMFS